MCLNKHGIDKNVVCLVTQVLVDINDPAFTDPQKRVGKIYSKEQAEELASKKGWIFKEEVKTAGWIPEGCSFPCPGQEL